MISNKKFYTGRGVDYIFICHIAILATAFGDAVFRLSADSNVTLFRALLPILPILVFARGRAQFVHLVIALFVYSVAQAFSLALSPYSPNFYNIAFFLNYMTIILFGFYVFSIERSYKLDLVDRLVVVSAYALMLTLSAQYLLGFDFPNIEHREGALRAWHGNENNASLALCAFLFYCVRFNTLRRHVLFVVMSVAIMVQNGSRAALVSVAVVLGYALYRKFGAAISLYILAFISMLSVMYGELFVSGFDVIFEIERFLINFRHSMEMMINLDVVTGVFTSLDVRSVAATLAIIDFMGHPVLGTGAGNTISLIIRNNGIFDSAIISTHNMPIAMLAELGVVGIFVMIYPLFRVSRLRKSEFVFWFLLYMFASLSAAGGFITNFFVLMTFVIVMTRPGARHVARQAPAHGPAAVSSMFRMSRS